MQPDLPLAGAPLPPAQPTFAARWRTANGAPLLLTAGATLVALAMLLPLAYLLIRAAEVGLAGAIESLTSPRTLQVVANSIVHFTHRPKPWHGQGDVGMSRPFYEAIDETEWKGWRPTGLRLLVPKLRRGWRLARQRPTQMLNRLVGKG